MPSTVKIDLPLCQSHGICYGMEPELVDADDDGKPQLLTTEPVDDARARALANCCPEFAISVEEAR